MYKIIFFYKQQMLIIFFFTLVTTSSDGDGKNPEAKVRLPQSNNREHVHRRSGFNHRVPNIFVLIMFVFKILSLK